MEVVARRTPAERKEFRDLSQCGVPLRCSLALHREMVSVPLQLMIEANHRSTERELRQSNPREVRSDPNPTVTTNESRCQSDATTITPCG